MSCQTITTTSNIFVPSAASATPIPPFIAKNWSTMRKYWDNRHTLFSRFDDGCQLDEESWYSVTPEWLAQETAQRLRCDTIVDPFCGAGGNVIQFAMTCRRVIAMDIDPHKIALARHNAHIYGVADRIEFRVGDFFTDNRDVRADIVFMSPPWGGPQYNRRSVFDIELDMRPGGTALMRRSLQMADTVVMFLPRRSNAEQLRRLAQMCEHPERRQVHIEQNVQRCSRAVPGLTAYMGDVAGKCRVGDDVPSPPPPPMQRRRMTLGSMGGVYSSGSSSSDSESDDVSVAVRPAVYVPPHIRDHWAAAAASEERQKYLAREALAGQRRRQTICAADDGPQVARRARQAMLRTGSMRRYDPIYRAVQAV